MAWTTKSPILENHWVPWGCRAHLGSVKELLNKEQIGNSEPFPMTNLPAYLIDSEQIGISEQFCNNPYYHNEDQNKSNTRPRSEPCIGFVDKRIFAYV